MKLIFLTLRQNLTQDLWLKANDQTRTAKNRRPNKMAAFWTQRNPVVATHVVITLISSDLCVFDVNVWLQMKHSRHCDSFLYRHFDFLNLVMCPVQMREFFSYKACGIYTSALKETTVRSADEELYAYITWNQMTNLIFYRLHQVSKALMSSQFISGLLVCFLLLQCVVITIQKLDFFVCFSYLLLRSVKAQHVQAVVVREHGLRWHANPHCERSGRFKEIPQSGTAFMLRGRKGTESQVW